MTMGHMMLYGDIIFLGGHRNENKSKIIFDPMGDSRHHNFFLGDVGGICIHLDRR